MKRIAKNVEQKRNLEESDMRIRRWIAGLLCICLLCTSDAFAVQAASLDTTSANSQKQELSTDELEKAEEVLQNKTSEEEQQGGTDNSEEKKSDPVDDMDSSDKKDSNVDSDKKVQIPNRKNR
jgi:hypothetical protein